MSQPGDWTPRPDPTLLTTEQLLREIGALERLLDARFLTLETKMAGHFLIDTERFSKTEEHFLLVESLRLEQKKDTKEALESALAAQKEAARKQDDATKETISKLSQLLDISARGLSDKVDDLKDRVVRAEASRQGASETKQEQRANITAVQAAVGIVVTVILLATLYFGIHTTTKTVCENQAHMVIQC